jgi:hypothetical protein
MCGPVCGLASFQAYRKLSYEGAHDEEQTDAARSAVDDVPDRLRKQYLFAKQRMGVDENDDTTKGVQIVKMPAGRGHLGQSIASIGLLLPYCCFERAKWCAL